MAIPLALRVGEVIAIDPLAKMLTRSAATRRCCALALAAVETVSWSWSRELTVEQVVGL